MPEIFERNAGDINSGKHMEHSGNMEAERPLDGIEQPFHETYLQKLRNAESANSWESERPGDYLPEAPAEWGNSDGNRFADFSGEMEGKAAENQKEVQREDAEEKKDGLTDEEKKELKERTGWPDEIIDSISSMEEAEIYEKAGLQAVKIDGKWCLIRSDIDLDQTDEDGISNRERMERGRPPITKDGKEVELHHIGQKQDSPLAELTMEEHRGTGNDTILHDKTKESEIDRTAFAKERKEHWKSRADS